MQRPGIALVVHEPCQDLTRRRSLEGETEHAIALRGFRIRCELAALRDQKPLRRQQRMSDHQQRRRHHQLEPHGLSDHENKMCDQNRDQQRGRDADRETCRQQREEKYQIQ